MDWILPALLTLAGFACLALAMKKHHKSVFGSFPAPTRVWTLRLCGWAALVAATAWCVFAFGASYGLIVVTGLLNAAGVAVALVLTYRYGDAPRSSSALRQRGTSSPAP